MQPRRRRWAREWDGPGPQPEFGPSPGFRNLKWLKPVYAGETVRYTRTWLDHRALAVAARLARAVDARRRLRFDRRQGDRVRQRGAGEGRLEPATSAWSRPAANEIVDALREIFAAMSERPWLARHGIERSDAPASERNSHAVRPSLLPNPRGVRRPRRSEEARGLLGELRSLHEGADTTPASSSPAPAWSRPTSRPRSG